MDINSYIKQINEQYKTGNAREHSYRPMLQQLLTDMLHGFIVTNEPARISCGAPDYIISRGDMPVFYIEAKDIMIMILMEIINIVSNSTDISRVSIMSFSQTILTSTSMKMENG